MACEITQADLGPLFADVPADVADDIIEAATEIVLGPAACQGVTYVKWVGCCVDPCRAIKLLAQHLLATIPNSGADGALLTSERVADVAVSYAGATSSDNIFAGSPYGLLYSNMLGRYEFCSTQRKGLPIAGGGRFPTSSRGGCCS